MSAFPSKEPEVDIDIEEMLDYLGVKNLEWRGSELWYTCPFAGHATDSNSNSSFREADKHEWWVFRCFVCGRRGTAIDFVAEAEGLTGAFARTKAKIWIREKYGKEWHDPGEGFAADIMKNLTKGARSRLEKRPLVELPEEILEDRYVDWEEVWEMMLEDEDAPPEWSTYLFKRGFTKATLKEFQIGFDPIRKMLTIPYRDAEGRLIGLKGRAWWPDAKPKYIFLGNKPDREDRYDFDTADISQVCFGVWQVQPEPRRLIVCEGELNKMAMHQYGHRRCVGVSGQFLSEFQQRQIVGLCDEAVLIFDENDKALQAAKALEKQIIVRVIPERECDPADASDELVAHWLDSMIDPCDLDGWYDWEDR